MREGSRKRRLMVGLVSIPFFIVASFSFGYAAQKNSSDNLLGFSVGDNSLLANIFPFSQAQAASSSAYPSGDIINNVILVDLKESVDPVWDLDASKIAFANTVLNGSTGSLQAYMKDISYGEINVDSKIYTASEGGFDGYQPEHDRSYYLNTTQGANPADLEEELLRDIIEQFKPKLASTSKEALDTNGDDYVDNVTFVIRGRKDSSHNLLWPHQYSLGTDENPLPTLTTSTGELKFKDYNIIMGGEGSTSEFAGIFNSANSDIGVIAHEYLHVYGFPDLYHNYKSGANGFVALPADEQIGDPLGKWDIMDYTISTNPQLPMVYTNKAYSPWGSNVPELPAIEASKTGVTLQKVAYNENSKDIAVMLKVDASLNPLAQDEYFMVEYRDKSGWDTDLPQSGLIVYRINLAVNHKNANNEINKFCDTTNNGNHCGNMFGAPDEVFIFRPNADSILHGNLGSNTDINLEDAAISPTNVRTMLGKTLAEVGSDNINVSNLGSTIYFSDGSNSGIVIKNVKDNVDGTMSFDVDFPQPVVDESKPLIDEPTGNGLNGNWINGSPAITLHVSDAGRGIESITVTTEDGEIMDGNDAVKSFTTTYEAADAKQNVNFEFHANKNGAYKVVAKDYAGNISDEKIVNVTNIDHILPEVIVGDTTKTSTEIRMEVTFKDDDSKIDTSSAFYTTLGLKDDTSNLTYDQAITNGEILLDVAFQGKVCITVKDNAGNAAKEPSCWVISNDKTQPVTSLTPSKGKDAWTSGNITITVQAKDDSDATQTGISTIEVTTTDGRIDHSNEKQLVKKYEDAGAQNEEFKFDVKANGTYHVNVCDYANNCNEATYEVSNIDQDAPVITKINAENAKTMALFSTSAHTITFEAHDEPVDKHSGLKEIRYQLVEKGETYIEDITATVWKTIALDAVLDTPENYEGMIYAYAIDNVGNVSKIAQKEIKRVNNDLPNGAFESGIVDTSGKVNIIGIDDPDVRVSLQDVDMDALKSKLGEDFLASHNVQNVYDISLLKNGSAYALTKEITVRFAVDESLRNDGSLMLMAIDTNGNTQEIAMTLGDGYIEFKTDKLELFALVSKVEIADKTATTLDNSPNTGDESSTLLYMMFMISMTSVVVTMVKKKYDTLNILDK